MYHSSCASKDEDKIKEYKDKIESIEMKKKQRSILIVRVDELIKRIEDEDDRVSGTRAVQCKLHFT